MKKKIRVAIYVRVSTQEQAKEGYSVGEQTDRLRKFAEAHDWIIVNVYVDAGHSGANTDRPALQEQRSKLKKEMEKLQSDSKRITEPEVIKLVQSFEEALDHGDLEDRRTIIEQLIEKIVINDDDITIHWNFI